MTRGYWGDAAATDATLTDDGWLRTGDLARKGLLGTVVFAGRQKDVIKHGGYSVYALEVEQALEEHPDVLEAAVVGLPDDAQGRGPRGRGARSRRARPRRPTTSWRGRPSGSPTTRSRVASSSSTTCPAPAPTKCRRASSSRCSTECQGGAVPRYVDVVGTAVVVVVASTLKSTNSSPFTTVTGYWCSPAPSAGMAVAVAVGEVLRLAVPGAARRYRWPASNAVQPVLRVVTDVLQEDGPRAVAGSWNSSGVFVALMALALALAGPDVELRPSGRASCCPPARQVVEQQPTTMISPCRRRCPTMPTIVARRGI